MKTIKLFLWVALLALVQGAWAQSYITDVMVVGADDDDDADAYYNYYVSQGWTGIHEDLNNNGGGHYIYLLYKTNNSPGSSGKAINDLFLWVSEHNNAPSSFVHNNHTYYMAGYDGDDTFKEKRGDLNCEAGGYWIHLFYTKDNGDYVRVSSITINNNKSGALGENGGGTPSDLNKDAGGDDIFMHISKSTVDYWINHRSSGYSHRDGETVYIENEAELALLSWDISNGYNTGYTFILNKDLDMSAYLWTPIGNNDRPFRSNFDGKGHTISGLHVYSTGSNNGLFGYVWGRYYTDAEQHLSSGCDYIRNFVLKDAYIEGRHYTAGIVGYFQGEAVLENVVCQADVIGGDYVGGLVGRVLGFSSANPLIPVNRAVIRNCLFLSGKVVGTGERGATIGSIGRDVIHTNIYYADPASDIGGNDMRAYPVTKSVPKGVTFSYTTSGGISYKENDYYPAGKVNFDLKYGVDQIVTVKVNGTEVAGTDGHYSFTIDPSKAASYAISVTVTESPVTGSGTEANPYLIRNEADWDYFANFLNGGQAPNGFSGKYFKLTADIQVSNLMMGTDDNHFKGIFDGDNHTVTVAFGSANNYLNKACGPFYTINGATIKNLMTTGNIYSSARYNGGLACVAVEKPCLIRNCVSSVNIYSNMYDYCGNGGLIGNLDVVRSEDSHATFEGCAFVGSLQGANAYNWGGLVGFLGTYTVLSLATVVFTDCLSAPTAVKMTTNDRYTNGAFCGYLASSPHLVTLSYTNCYYTQPLQTSSEGKQAYIYDKLPASIGEEKTAYGFITAYANGLKCGDSYYSLLDIVALADHADNSTVISQKDGDFVNASISGRTLYTDGNWNTLCLPFNVNKFDGTPLQGATVMTLDVEGEYNGHQTGLKSDGKLYLYFKEVSTIEAGKPYLVKWKDEKSIGVTINSADDWNTFALNVNSGKDSYEGKLVRLGSDIHIVAVVGTAEHPFKGIFDGAGHTLSFSFEDTKNQGTAPFRYISGATIANVRTTGTVKGNRHCSGLVGFANSGTNTIRNCHVDVSVTATDKYVGGVLGHGTSSTTTVADCLFTGSITGPEEANIGIFDAWNNKGSHSVVNCLAAGTYDASAKIAYRNDGAKNCYSKSGRLEDAADASAMTNEDLLAALGAGWEIVNGNVVPKTIAVNITGPVFQEVTIRNVLSDVTSSDFSVTFKGIYDPVEIGDEGDNTKLYFSAGNTLYWPNGAMTFNPFRAYFQLNTTTANARSIVLTFDDDETTNVVLMDNGKWIMDNEAGAWFTLDGRKLQGEPKTKGIYIYKGTKIIKK